MCLKWLFFLKRVREKQFYKNVFPVNNYILVVIVHFRHGIVGDVLIKDVVGVDIPQVFCVQLKDSAAANGVAVVAVVGKRSVVAEVYAAVFCRKVAVMVVTAADSFYVSALENCRKES